MRSTHSDAYAAYAAMYIPSRPWYGRTIAKRLYTAVTVGLVSTVFFMTSMAGATNLSIGGPSDCDDNAIIRCGAHSVNALMQEYRQSAYVRAVYASFGISNADMASLPGTAVEGKVTKQGDVYAGGRLVARNAVTGGRQDIPGSTKVNANGAIFFKRPPNVSFASDSLPAYVSMQNGRFGFAVIASCGNAVAAAAVVQKAAVAPAHAVSQPQPKQKPPHKPQPPKPAPQPQPQPQQTQTQTQTQQNNQQVTQNQQVTVENNNKVVTPPAQTPASTPTASAPVEQQPAQTVASAPQEQPAQTQVAASTPATLPNTGPGDIFGVFMVTSLIGYLGHRIFLRRMTV